MIPWKMIISKYVKHLINGVIAGILISLASFFSIIATNEGSEIISVIISSFGFLFVALYGYDFYTGKIGNLLENKADYLLELLMALIGNFIGAWVVALLSKVTSYDVSLFVLAKAEEIAQGSWALEALIKSLIAGIVIYFVFNTYKKAEQPIARFSSLLLGAIVIYFLGFNEIVSELFYCNLGALNGCSYGSLMSKIIFVFTGNTLGALFIPLLRKLKSVL